MNIESLNIPMTAGCTGCANTPALSAAQMKAKFDELSRDYLQPKVNELIAALNSTYSKAEADAAITAALNKTGSVTQEQMAYWDSKADAAHTHEEYQPRLQLEELASSEDITITAEDGMLYSVTLGANTLTIDVAQMGDIACAHILLSVTSDDALLAISNATLVFGDSVDDIASGQTWEISILAKQVVIKNVTA